MKILSTIGVVAVMLGAPLTARAQGIDSKWQPWLGCWQRDTRASADTASVVCVLPSADGRGVTTRSFGGDREVRAELLVADGTPQRVSENGCSGERTIQWAASGPRYFTNTTLTCEGQPAAKTSSISALVRPDVWLDVQVSGVKGGEQVRTRRLLRFAGAPPAPVAEQVRALRPMRITPAPVTADDVIDASGRASAMTVEAWLAESGARATLDRRGLVHLADAHVQESVIDLLVAMAYPQKFQVRRNSTGGGGGLISGAWMDDGFYPGGWSDLYDIYGYGFGSFGLPFMYGAFGAGYPYYPGGGVYFIPGDGSGGGGAQVEHGRVVNGQGYTRVEPKPAVQGAAASGGRSSTGSPSDAGSYSGQSSSGGSAGDSGSATPSGYSGGGGGSTGQTAVPR